MAGADFEAIERFAANDFVKNALRSPRPGPKYEMG